MWGLQRRAWWPGGLPAASRSSRRAAGGAVWGVLFRARRLAWICLGRRKQAIY